MYQISIKRDGFKALMLINSVDVIGTNIDWRMSMEVASKKDEEKIMREFLTTRKKLDVVQIIREASSLDHALKLMNGLAANGHLTIWDNATHPDGSSYHDLNKPSQPTKTE